MKRLMFRGMMILVALLAVCTIVGTTVGPPLPGAFGAEVPHKVLAFYYPWYGNPHVEGGSGRWSHWSGVDQQHRSIDSSTHYPALGPYDSHDAKLIEQHCRWAKEAGIDGWIVSWWGHGSFEDRAMERILDQSAKAALEVTVYYETVPGRKTAAEATDDLARLLKRYAGHNAWLRVGDRPVVFIYGRAIGQLRLPGWREVTSRLGEQCRPQPLLIGDRISEEAAKVFHGLHTYNTAGALRGKSLQQIEQWARDTYPRWVQIAEQAGKISTITVIPGYDDTKIRTPGLSVERFDGASYRVQWEQAIAADPDWILITSWNEWHEGSEIEPSAELGHKYLKLTGEMARRFKQQ